MVILCDVDGVVADLHKAWLDMYNRDYDHDLTTERVVTWAIHEHVKPEARHAIYTYLRRSDLYDNVQPIVGALEGVKCLRALGHRVVFVTSNVLGMSDPKWSWLVKHGFLPDTTSQPDLIMANDKALIAGHALIDDRDKNVFGWAEANAGVPILFDAPYNRGSICPAHIDYFRCKTWEDITRTVLLEAEADYEGV